MNWCHIFLKVKIETGSMAEIGGTENFSKV